MGKHYLSAHNSAEGIKCYQTALRLQPDISHLRQSGQTHKHERVQQITSTTMASENLLCSIACAHSTPQPTETCEYLMTTLENAIHVLQYTDDEAAENAAIHLIHKTAKICDMAQQRIVSALI